MALFTSKCLRLWNAATASLKTIEEAAFWKLRKATPGGLLAAGYSSFSKYTGVLTTTKHENRAESLLFSLRGYQTNRLATYNGGVKISPSSGLLGMSYVPTRTFEFQHRNDISLLWDLHRKGPHKKFRPPRKPLDGKPMLKGVILKTLIKKPKKPNSANRKCVLVRLSNGKEAVAHVPGEGHNLQEHNVVLVRCGRLQDVPGVKLKCIRGVYDLPHVIKSQKA